MLGAAAAAVLDARHGRLAPVLWGGAAGLVAAVSLLLPFPAAFAAGTLVGSVAWAWSIPYVLGGCAASAPEGGAVWSSFVAKLGLAAGPLLGRAGRVERTVRARHSRVGGVGDRGHAAVRPTGTKAPGRGMPVTAPIIAPMIVRRPQKWSTRLVARQVSRLLIVRARRGRAGGYHAGMVFEVVLGASIAHHAPRDASGRWLDIADWGVVGRPVNAAAIAQSMALPGTTVRRRAADLVAAELLVREAAGFRPSPDIFANGWMARVAVKDTDDLMHTLAALAESDYRPAVAALAGIGTLPPGVIAQLLIAFALRTMETFTDLYGDLTAGTLSAAIVNANVCHITTDPVLAERYAEEDMQPPDALRRPIGCARSRGKSTSRSRRSGAASPR